MYVDINFIVKEYLRNQDISMYTLAHDLKITPPTLYKSLAGNLTIARLQAISDALRHNFFVYYVDDSGGSEEEVLRLKRENRELGTKVLGLQKEVEYLKEINGLLKLKREG
jgi:hypothetical protein